MSEKERASSSSLDQPTISLKRAFTRTKRPAGLKNVGMSAQSSMALPTPWLPATGAYLSVLRTATAGLASRLDFTIDDIEDLRIAVDEACAMLLPRAQEGALLECQFELKPGVLDISVSLPTTDPSLPS